MVYLDAKRRELITNGEIHLITRSSKYDLGMVLYTENFINLEGKATYISIVTVNKGKEGGMYVALHDAATDIPEAVIPVRCRYFDWQRG